MFRLVFGLMNMLFCFFGYVWYLVVVVCMCVVCGEVVLCGVCV